MELSLTAGTVLDTQECSESQVPQGAGMDLAKDIGSLFTEAQIGATSSDVMLRLKGPEDSAAISIPVHRSVRCHSLNKAAIMDTH